MFHSFPWISLQSFRMSVKAVNVHDDGERGKDAATALHVHRTHDDRWTLHDSQRNSCSKPYSKKSVSNNAFKKKIYFILYNRLQFHPPH